MSHTLFILYVGDTSCKIKTGGLPSLASFKVAFAAVFEVEFSV